MFLLNGQRADSISLQDRGLNYGDGLFETIAVIEQQPLCLDKHLERLLSGCEKLKIDFNDINVLKSEIDFLCKTRKRAVLKITITSGNGGRGYQRVRPGPVPTRLLALHPWPDYPWVKYTDDHSLQGSSIHLCTTRLGHNPGLAGIKHLNRLEQVLARNEWDSNDISEGLMLDINDNVIAGTMSNLFAITSEKTLLTPDLSRAGIKGIIRQYILDYGHEIGYKSKVCQLTIDDLYSAREIFFCNSVAGILPVRQLAKHEFSSQLSTNEIRQYLISRGVIARL